MRILVVGAGSVGGYFGARLAQAGRDVTFLVRPERSQQLHQKGLRIRSPHGDFSLQPKLMNSAELDTPYDLILLSVKAYALEEAIADFAAAVGDRTMILPVLNGMRQIEVLTNRFGAGPVLGGVALIVADVDQERRIVQSADIQQLTYGELSGGISSRIKTLDQTLANAGFDAQASSDITQAMWEKWVQLASLGAVNCLMRGTIGDVVAARGGADLARAVIGECAAIAAACGHPPSEGLLDRHTGLMTQAGSALTSSMYRDMRRGAHVEAEHILGDLRRRAVERNVAAPLLEAALVNLRIYEAALGRAR
jgi:2-dehydropantoate 2-reductase